MKIVFLEADSLGEDMKLDHFFEIGEVVVYGKTTVEQVPERIAEADAVIVNKLPMNKETLSGAGFLKYIGLTATGVNNIDFDYTNKRGITVTNVAGYSTEVVAQHTFAMMFYLLEHLRYYDDYVKSGKYIKSESFCHMDRRFTELAGKTWGIIGLGAIGKKVAELATAFGCKVIYYSASGKKRSEVYEQTDLDKIVKKVTELRIFNDDAGKTNLSLQDVGGGLLVVSQFTLLADCKKGRRPSFVKAGNPQKAEEMYEEFIRVCKEKVSKVEHGVFGANMKVELLNDGPFTIVLDSKEL